MTDTLPGNEPATHAEEAFSFSGGSGEFTRIWWTNLMLSVCTLGIYSAWAKVRTRKWFYGNTALAGSAFNYHADPIAILKGRLVVVGIYVALVLASEFLPALGQLLFLPILLVIPWIVVRSLRFNAINTSYRGLRFDFAADYAAAYVLLLKLLLVILTAGLAWPWWRAGLMRFLARHRYGSAAFSTEFSTAKVFGVYFRASSMLLLVIALVAGALAATGVMQTIGEDFRAIQEENARLAEQASQTADSTDGVSADEPGKEITEERARTFVTAVFAAYGGLFLLFVLVSAYLEARLTNMLWTGMRLGEHVSFRCTLRARDLAWLRVSNFLICLFTLFIAYPVTQVRNARYRLSRMTVSGNLDGFIAGQGGDGRALGEEAGDLLDIDFAL